MTSKKPILKRDFITNRPILKKSGSGEKVSRISTTSKVATMANEPSSTSLAAKPPTVAESLLTSSSSKTGVDVGNSSSSAYLSTAKESTTYPGTERIVKIDGNTFVIETSKEVYLNTTEQITKQQYISHNIEGVSGYSGINGQDGTTLSEIPYDVMFAIYELIPVNTVFGAALMARHTELTANSVTDSIAIVKTPPSATTTFIVQKFIPSTNVTTDIGSITFTAGNRNGEISLTPTTFNRGEVLQIASTSVDASLFGFLATIITYYVL